MFYFPMIPPRILLPAICFQSLICMHYVWINSLHTPKACMLKCSPMRWQRIHAYKFPMLSFVTVLSNKAANVYTRFRAVSIMLLSVQDFQTLNKPMFWGLSSSWTQANFNCLYMDILIRHGNIYVSSVHNDYLKWSVPH